MILFRDCIGFAVLLSFGGIFLFLQAKQLLPQLLVDQNEAKNATEIAHCNLTTTPPSKFLLKQFNLRMLRSSALGIYTASLHFYRTEF